MPRRARLDAELVRRGLARSRQQASELIETGAVLVQGMVAKKPATAVDNDTSIQLRTVGEKTWASRGAHKLLGALTAFMPQGLTVAGKRCLDAGASTGGFTDVLLQHGATQVLAVDVGRGLLDWRLQTDERVIMLDRTNVRSLTQKQLNGPVELVVGDLSFISLRLVFPALAECCLPGADLVLMVKPQFEVGKEKLGKGGVVRDPHARASAIREVAHKGLELGLEVRDVTASPLPGPAGNVEYFVWFQLPSDDKSTVDRSIDLDSLVHTAIAEGPA